MANIPGLKKEFAQYSQKPGYIKTGSTQKTSTSSPILKSSTVSPPSWWKPGLTRPPSGGMQSTQYSPTQSASLGSMSTRSRPTPTAQIRYDRRPKSSSSGSTWTQNPDKIDTYDEFQLFGESLGQAYTMQALGYDVEIGPDGSYTYKKKPEEHVPDYDVYGAFGLTSNEPIYESDIATTKQRVNTTSYQYKETPYYHRGGSPQYGSWRGNRPYNQYNGYRSYNGQGSYYQRGYYPQRYYNRYYSNYGQRYYNGWNNGYQRRRYYANRYDNRGSSSRLRSWR